MFIPSAHAQDERRQGVLRGGLPCPGGRGAVIAEDRRVRGGRVPCAGGLACWPRRVSARMADDRRVTDVHPPDRGHETLGPSGLVPASPIAHTRTNRRAARPRTGPSSDRRWCHSPINGPTMGQPVPARTPGTTALDRCCRSLRPRNDGAGPSFRRGNESARPGSYTARVRNLRRPAVRRRPPDCPASAGASGVTRHTRISRRTGNDPGCGPAKKVEPWSLNFI